jgi:hypothetical protein
MLGAARGDLADEDNAAFSCARVSFSSPGMLGLLCSTCHVHHVFSRGRCSGRASHAASLWLDLAEGRLRLDRLGRNGAGSTFFPWARPIPREATKSHQRRPPLRFGPRAGASSIACGFPIAIEAAVVAGSRQPKEK